MPVEIERKFLVEGNSWRPLVRAAIDLRQAYLMDGERLTIRVRASPHKAWLTIKSAVPGMKRDEFEYPIPTGDAEALFSLAQSPLVEKRRHLVKADGATWEIDEFQGENEGLIVAEIELDHEDQSFARPGWIGREVTNEKRYYNASLSRRPYKKWTREEIDGVQLGE